MIDRETDAGNGGADEIAIAETPTAAPTRDFDAVRNEIADKLLAGEDDVAALEKEIDATPKGPTRGPDGKFAPKEADDPAKAAEPVTQAPVAADPAKAAIDPAKPVTDQPHGRMAPAWLAPEAKDAWSKAPTPVVDAFMKRAREFETANSTLGRENKQLGDFHAQHAPFQQVAEQYEHVWRGAGHQHPAQTVAALFENHLYAMSDPVSFAARNLIGDSDPRAFIGALAKAYNLDIANLAIDGVPEYQRPEPQQRGPAPQRPVDPNEIYQRARADTQAEFHQQQQSAYLDHYRAQTPVVGNDSYGNPVHEFDELGDDLAIVIQHMRQANPNLGIQELLDAAYPKAVALSETATARRKSAEQEAAKAASAAAQQQQATQRLSRTAKKAASINVTGSPNRNPGPVDVRNLQMQALDEMGYSH